MENTRKARRVPGPIEAADIQNLLAAINKHEARNKVQVPADRSTKHMPGVSEPVCSPTNHPWRVADILDSLSALLVSKDRHEVIAIALRVDTTLKTIEFIIATNVTVPTTTSSHLTWIWATLKKISSRYLELYPHQKEENSPTHEIKDSQLRSQLNEFTRQCIKFIFSRVQKRVNTKFTEFFSIDSKKFGGDHPFLRVRRAIVALEAMFIREQGATYGKPLDHDEDNWKLLLGLLRECQESVKDLFNKGGLTQAELPHVRHFVKWETYLRKIAALMNDVDVLVRAANSPRCRHLFPLTFKQHAIPPMSSRAMIVPQTARDWETVLEKALSHRNNQERQQSEFEPKVMKMPVIARDTAYMAQEVIGKDLVMHCEVKILLAIARVEAERPNIAKAYSYIGVSKLSCRGCHAFLQAYNRAHDSRFVTRGSHGKSCWPWQFPRDFLKSEETVMYTYSILAQRWVNSYNGYESELVHLGPDSTAGSQTSRTVIWDQDQASQDRMHEYLKKFDNM